MRKRSRFYRREIPYPGETLLSWLLRIAKVNHYSGINFMLRFLRRELKRSYLVPAYLDKNIYPQILTILAEMTDVSEDELRNMVFPAYFDVFILNPVVQSVFPQIKTHNLFRSVIRHSPRLCPSCLREAIYIRQLWHLDFYLVCSDHEVELLQKCPNCQHEWQSGEIIADKCRGCGHAYSELQDDSISNVSANFHTQRRLLSWYLLETHDVASLPDIGLLHVLSFLYGLHDVMLMQGEAAERDSSSINAQLHAYSEALKIIDTFPSGFHSFLDEFREKQVSERNHGFEREFGLLYQKWLLDEWTLPDYRFIHQAFNDYLKANFVPYYGIGNARWLDMYPSLRENTDFITIEEALKRFLHIKLTDILVAIRGKQLTVYPAPNGYLEYLRISDLRRLFDSIDRQDF